jgi:hypothetical protein
VPAYQAGWAKVELPFDVAQRAPCVDDARKLNSAGVENDQDSNVADAS